MCIDHRPTLIITKCSNTVQHDKSAESISEILTEKLQYYDKSRHVNQWMLNITTVDIWEAHRHMSCLKLAGFALWCSLICPWRLGNRASRVFGWIDLQPSSPGRGIWVIVPLQVPLAPSSPGWTMNNGSAIEPEPPGTSAAQLSVSRITDGLLTASDS